MKTAMTAGRRIQQPRHLQELNGRGGSGGNSSRMAARTAAEWQQDSRRMAATTAAGAFAKPSANSNRNSTTA